MNAQNFPFAPGFSSEAAFLDAANGWLDAVADRLDAAIGDVADVERQEGTLAITLPDGRQFLLNRHAVTRQLWLSSPLTGGWHFDWNADKNSWVATRAEAELLALLTAELAQALGRRVEI